MQGLSQRIKLLAEDGLKEWGIAILVLLTGIASFGLGRLSALEAARPAISIGQAAAAAVPALPAGGEFEASRTGNIYYYPWCGGAQKIAADDQVWFTSGAAAQKAGYRAAKNCKGL